jgi:hypothetical protein
MTDALRFRKKPLVIEAWRWTGDPKIAASSPPEWLVDAINKEGAPNTTPGMVMRIGDQLHIATLEGVVVARPGDWVIRGIKGELYPCKPAIFDSTYAPAQQASKVIEEGLEAAQRIISIDEGGPEDEVEYLDSVAVARALDEMQRPPLDWAVAFFADAADFNVTCFEAYGEGHVPADAMELYELGKKARAIIEKKAEPTDDKVPI